MSRKLIWKQFGPNAQRYVTSEVHAKQSSLQRLVSQVNPKSHWNILDVATATGQTGLSFASFTNHVVASDLTPEMLLVAREQAELKDVGNMSYVLADAQDLLFESRAFNLVTCRFTPHHFPNIKIMVAESRRVLRDGGTPAVVDNVTVDPTLIPDSYSKVNINEAARIYNLFEKIRDPSHQCALSVSLWQAHFRQNGFELQLTEIADEPMAFKPWVARLNTQDEDCDRLLDILHLDRSPFLKKFLRPRVYKE